MIMKKAHMSVLTISLAGMLLVLAGCEQKAETPEAASSFAGASLSSEAGSALLPSAAPEPVGSSMPDTSSTVTSVPTAAESTVASAPAASKRPAKPASSAPKSSVPVAPSSAVQPVSSASPPPAVTEPTSSEPVYTEADYQAIIDEIRRYGESKGFVWNDSLAIGVDGIGYYGRPDLTNDGYDGVISMLKFYCNKILREYGICYFKVVRQLYAGNMEFIVLYA